jgi:hypothetical protein
MIVKTDHQQKTLDQTKLVAFKYMLLGIATLPIAAYWFGFVASNLWKWFIVPLGVMAITPVHAFGIAILILMVHATNRIRTQVRLEKLTTMMLAGTGLEEEVDMQIAVAQEKINEAVTSIVIPFASPLVAYIAGFICQQYMR